MPIDEWISGECQIVGCIMPSVEEVKTSVVYMDDDGVSDLGTEMVSMCLEHAAEETSHDRK